MGSQPAPSLLVETLCSVHDLLDLLELFRSHAAEGRQFEASRCLTTAVAAAPSFLPVLKGLIAAQRQAAKHLDLAQRPNVRVLASIGIAQPQPDPANSEHAPTPEQPSPSVA
jgi:hypothetical protein